MLHNTINENLNEIYQIPDTSVNMSKLNTAFDKIIKTHVYVSQVLLVKKEGDDTSLLMCL